MEEQAALARANGRYSAARVAEVRDVRSYLRDYQVGGGTVAALERLLARCRADRLAVLLLAPPVASAHRACYSAAIEAEIVASSLRIR